MPTFLVSWLIVIFFFSMFTFLHVSTANALDTSGVTHDADSLWVEDATTGATSCSWNLLTNRLGDKFTAQFYVNLSFNSPWIDYVYVEFTWPNFLTFVSIINTTVTGSYWELETATKGQAGFGAVYPGGTWPPSGNLLDGVSFNVTFIINSEPTKLTSPFTGAINVTFSNVNGGNTWYTERSGNDLFAVPFSNAYDLPITYTWWIPGDINGDGKVDGRDMTIAAKAFGTSPGDPKWNPLADIDQDGRVDGRDMTIIAKHFGQHDP